MKIIVIPHTHWDREWYFTNEVSHVLLKYNIDNFLNSKANLESFYLDGQVSLLEDYLTTADNLSIKKLLYLIKQNKIVIGPLYSQPDVFNSLGETTIRNSQIASEYLEQKKLPKSDIFYCPDTFGFGFNIPQIINYLGFDKFVFWRGLSKEYSNSDFNLWKGIDGTIISSYRMKFGYWKISSFFPWKNLDLKNIKSKAKEFLDSFLNSELYNHYYNQSKLNNGIIIVPFGGDQAPIHPLTQKFFEEVNNLSLDEWKIGKFNDFFKENDKPNNIIEGTIDYGYESKIHRTISSSRYDFKKLFRENEINLYHQLEPLEMMYKIIDKNYSINNSSIIKKLTCMQAHDILGGCVTDDVFLSSYQKLLDIRDSINAKKEIILRQISVEMDLDNNKLLIFNPSSGSNHNNFSIIKIYTNNEIIGQYIDNQIEVIALESTPYKAIKDSFETKLIILNKNIRNFSFMTFDLTKLINKKIVEQNYLEFEKFLNFKIIYDDGDLFDADPNIDNHPEIEIRTSSSKIFRFNSFDLIQISGEIIIDKISNNYDLSILNINEVNYYSIKILNKMENIIVKWIPPLKIDNNVSFLQHLGIDNYNFEKIDEWQSMGYKENPINIKKNSGLIFDDKSFICTRGTNEFLFENSQLEITLYRSTGVLGKANLKNRPGDASGIENHVINTPLGQLESKELTFDFKYGKYKGKVSNELNNFYRTPIIHHNDSNNLIESILAKFVFLKKNLEIKNQNIDLPKNFISSSFYKDNKMHFLMVNFEKKAHDFNKMIVVELEYEK